jgi:hypothetical protein
MEPSIEELYPNIARWVNDYGWVEVGQDGQSNSFVRALDEGGLIWEGKDDYQTLDDALRALDAGISKWMREEYGEE